LLALDTAFPFWISIYFEFSNWNSVVQLKISLLSLLSKNVLVQQEIVGMGFLALFHQQHLRDRAQFRPPIIPLSSLLDPGKLND
jgi:hypothetical protein